MGHVIGVVYEITENPFFGSSASGVPDHQCDLVRPSEMNDLLRAIRRLEHEVVVIDGVRQLRIDGEKLANKTQLLFNKSRGVQGEDRKVLVPALAQALGLPYTGSGAYVLSLTRHKYHTNRLLSSLGFSVPNAVCVHQDERLDRLPIQPPIIVKPNYESGALGITDASVLFDDKDVHQLNNLVHSIHTDFRQAAIVEEFVPGEEWKLPVIGNGSDATAVGCVSTNRDGIPIVDKWITRAAAESHAISYTRPTATDRLREAYRLAPLIHTALGCRDYSRVDFRIRPDGSLATMEVSTHPDLSLDSSFVTAADQSFGHYHEIIGAIIGAAMSRVHIAGRSNCE